MVLGRAAVSAPRCQNHEHGWSRSDDPARTRLQRKSPPRRPARLLASITTATVVAFLDRQQGVFYMNDNILYHA